MALRHGLLRLSKPLISTCHPQFSSIPLENVFLDPEKPQYINRAFEDGPRVTVDEKGYFQLPVMSLTSTEPCGEASLDPSVFGAEFRPDILQRSVKWYLANARAGTHKTKSRSEVRGSTRKMWPQKGSGRARVGDRRAPQWRGGYTVHGKSPRDYSFDLPKKVRRMGVRVALSAKLREGRLAIVDDLMVESHKTKHMMEILNNKGWNNILFLSSGPDINPAFEYSCRSIKDLDILPERNLSVYSILKRDILVASVEAIESLQSRLAIQ